MKQYSLFIEGLGDPYFDKRLTYGTLDELTTYLTEYFKQDLDPNDEEDELVSSLDLLEYESDPNVYAGILKYSLDWFIVIGTFTLYDDEGTKIEPIGLNY